MILHSSCHALVCQADQGGSKWVTCSDALATGPRSCEITRQNGLAGVKSRSLSGLEPEALHQLLRAVDEPEKLFWGHAKFPFQPNVSHPRSLHPA